MPNFYRDSSQRSPDTGFRPGRNLPVISTQLDSVRAYQFEVQFEGVPNQAAERVLTLAAKLVGTMSFGVEPIKVNRVNDLVLYPGQVTHEPVKITFDNLYAFNTNEVLWDWFKTVYDPITGNTANNPRLGSPDARPFKCKRMTILELDNTKTPIASVELYGVYPTRVEFTERNYAQNEFNTMIVDFSYDFIDYNRN